MNEKRNKKIKVLYILWSGRIGGAEQYVFTLANELDRDLFELTICFLNEELTIGDELIKRGFNVNVLHMKTGQSVVGFVRLILFLLRNKFDVIHCHCRNYLLNMLFAVFLKKSQKIYCENGGDIASSNPAKEVMFYRLFSKYYDSIQANSEHIKILINELGKVPSEKIFVLYNGIKLTKFRRALGHTEIKDFRREFGINNDFVVVVVARLSAEKGIDDFIEIAFKIAKCMPKTTFLIVGDGPEREHLINKINSIKTESNVPADIRLLGFRRDVDMILSISDIYLFTSRHEAFGISLVEALALGIPIVGFDIPGANEVVRNGRNGFLIKKRDLNELAKLCVSLLCDSNQRNIFSQNNIEDARKFDITKHVKKMEEIYRDLVCGKSNN